MKKKIAGVSDTSIKKATGKNWEEWFKLLDRVGAAEMTHKEIASMLSDEGLIENPWWCQEVTVGYEKARGRRVTGQTAGAGFQIGVQRTLAIEPGEAWELMLTQAGLAIWLGKTRELSLEPGQKYQTSDGASGEIRSVVFGKKIRLTWHPPSLKRESTVQLYLVPRGQQTVFRLHQEKLSSEEEREQMRRHWQRVLTAIEELAERASPSTESKGPPS